MHKILIVIAAIFFLNPVQSQELRGRVSVVANRVGNNVDRKVFNTLQTALNNLVNNRKWTNVAIKPEERIECSFLVNLEPTDDANVYRASLTVQAARPIFNSSYLSPLINWKDDDVIFKYLEFQQLEFNENRVAGTDALASNLTAVIAYYVYAILALDFDSFSPRGGDIYYQKAQNVINNAPEGRNISGWKPFDGNRNRYWLIENLMNTRYTLMHDAYYGYYRKGMDKLYEDEAAGRTEIINVLSLLNTFNTENPNTMIIQFFFQGKSQELIRILAKAPPQERLRASEFLQKLDISNATKYKDGLK